jgi:hypothetical protein
MCTILCNQEVQTISLRVMFLLGMMAVLSWSMLKSTTSCMLTLVEKGPYQITGGTSPPLISMKEFPSATLPGIPMHLEIFSTRQAVQILRTHISEYSHLQIATGEKLYPKAHGPKGLGYIYQKITSYDALACPPGIHPQLWSIIAGCRTSRGRYTMAEVVDILQALH